MSTETIEMMRLKKRVAFLEERMAELEDSHGKSLFKLTRKVTKVELNIEKMLTEMNLTGATEEDVDSRLDSE